MLNSERKFGHLERLHPDIAVVSECRIGDPGRKGLAVICYNGRRIGELGPSIAQKWFAPLRLTNGDQVIQVVGVWLNEASDYVQPTIAAWETLRPFVEKGPTILAGDFNQSVVFDKAKGPGRRFADVLKLLDEASLVSAWHAQPVRLTVMKAKRPCIGDGKNQAGFIFTTCSTRRSHWRCEASSWAHTTSMWLKRSAITSR